MPIRSAPNPSAFITPPLPDLFLVRITVVNSGTPDTYEFEEWHTTSTTSGLPGTTGPWEVKAGGRIGTSDNPGYAIPAADGTETTFAVDDFAWCRSAAGNAGLTWELVPISGAGSAAVTTWKEPARVMATSNVDVTTALENGDTLNGVTLATGDRVFLPFQTTATQRLVWVVQASGTAVVADDMVSGTMGGAMIVVNEGTSYADTIWQCTTNEPTGVGATSLTWKQVIPLTTKGDILVHNGTELVRLPVGANTEVLTADSAESSGVKWGTPSSIVLAGGSAAWIRYTVTYTTLSTAATTNTVTLTTLPAKSLLLGAYARVLTSFSGGGITTYSMNVGYPTNLAAYLTYSTLSSVSNYNDLYSAVGDDNFALFFPGTPMDQEFSGAVVRKIRQSNGGTVKVNVGANVNLNLATQGEVEIMLYVVTLP